MKAALLPELQPVTVDFGYLSGNAFEVSFFDPSTGKRVKNQNVTERKVQRLASPRVEDLLVIIRGN